MSVEPEAYYSLEEYFTLEEAGEGKHEYFQGTIYAMTGASLRHNYLVANIISSLRPQLRGKRCAVYPSDLRVKVEATGLYTYPDVSVVCAPPHYDGTRQDTVLNPTVIIEVLSASSENYDRGTKFQHYRTITTLSAYLLIAQHAPRVDLFARQADNRWLLSEYTSLDQQVLLDGIGCVLPLAAIYEEVTFDKEMPEGV